MNHGNPEISSLILDFGGVIYRISHQKQKETFTTLGLGNFDDLYSQARQSPLFADFERGTVSNDEFRKAIRKMVGREVTHEMIDEAWNSILVDYPKATVALLEQLSSRYQLFLLSNTNEIHYKVYIREFLDQYGYDFNTLFTQTFWSHQIGMRKPDDDIYQFVRTKTGITPDAALFIDDTRINTEAAIKNGIPSFWLQPGKTLGDLFETDLSLRL
jgi:glucose-1-phosphatase